MHYYYITGTSRGIGKALAEALLKPDQPACKVVGMSRSVAIDHPNYSHVTLDLADLEAVKAFQFNVPEDANRVVLINNAGTLGEVGAVGQISDNSIINAYHINLVSPSILTNRFLKEVLGVNGTKIVLNISSGAGKYAIDGWATYCATKAGLDLFSCTVEEELKINGNSSARILSVAPGVVDTEMQAVIRESDEKAFSRIDDFIEYKNSGNLADPQTVAAKYLHILSTLSEFDGCLHSVRDVEIN